MPEPGLSAIDSENALESPRYKRWTILLLKIAVSGGLLVFLARQTSWDRFSSRLNEIVVTNVLLALLPLVAITFFLGYRWRVIASAVARPICFFEAWIITLIGAALDHVLVMMSGDAYRIWWLRKGTPSLSCAVAGVLLDRVAGVLGIALLVLGFLPCLVNIESAQGLIWVPPTLAAVIVCGFAILLILDRLPFNLSKNRWLARLTVLSSSARNVFLSPFTAIPVIIAAMLVHVGVSICIACLAWALGIGLGLGAALTVVPSIMLISLLPISIGGWGVREGAMIVGLGMVGIQSSDALLISVTFGLGATVISISGGMLWLLGLPRGPAQTASG